MPTALFEGHSWRTKLRENVWENTIDYRVSNYSCDVTASYLLWTLSAFTEGVWLHQTRAGESAQVAAQYSSRGRTTCCRALSWSPSASPLSTTQFKFHTIPTPSPCQCTMTSLIPSHLTTLCLDRRISLAPVLVGTWFLWGLVCGMY